MSFARLLSKPWICVEGWSWKFSIQKSLLVTFLLQNAPERNDCKALPERLRVGMRAEKEAKKSKISWLSAKILMMNAVGYTLVKRKLELRWYDRLCLPGRVFFYSIEKPPQVKSLWRVGSGRWLPPPITPSGLIARPLFLCCDAPYRCIKTKGNTNFAQVAPCRRPILQMVAN